MCGSRFATDKDKTIFCVDCRKADDKDENNNSYEWYPFLCGESFGMSGFCELWGSLFRYRRMTDVDHINPETEKVDPSPWGGVLEVPGKYNTKDVRMIRDMRFAKGESREEEGQDVTIVSGNVYFDSYRALLPATPATDALSKYDSALCIGERSFYADKSGVGLVGECLAFDRALEDDEVTEVRDYLRSKWLDGRSAVLSGRLELANNSVIDLGGKPRTFAEIAGGGRFKDGDVTVTGKVTLTVKDDGTIDPLVVDGTLDLSGAAVELVNAKRLSVSNQTLAVVAGSLVGELPTQIRADDATVRLTVSNDGQIYLRRAGGLCIVIR